MKFILFDINDTNKNIINKIQLDNTCYIQEVSFSKNILEYMLGNHKGILANIKRNIYERNIEKNILKALEKHNEKWCYILSKKANNIKLATTIAEEMLGNAFIAPSELNTNLHKYIDSYATNKSLKKHEIKILLVAKANKSLNFSLLSRLIQEYRCVNIYLEEKPTSDTLKQIKQINKTEGTTIDVVKKERKSFVDYNVIYFVDDIKTKFPRLRLNKESLVIDVQLAHKDRFNTNIVFFNEYIENKYVLKDNIKALIEKYDTLELASVIRKIVN